MAWSHSRRATNTNSESNQFFHLTDDASQQQQQINLGIEYIGCYRNEYGWKKKLGGFFCLAPSQRFIAFTSGGIWKTSKLSEMWRVLFNKTVAVDAVAVFLAHSSAHFYSDWSIVVFGSVYQWNRAKKRNALITISFGAASILGPFSITTRSYAIVSC